MLACVSLFVLADKRRGKTEKPGAKPDEGEIKAQPDGDSWTQIEGEREAIFTRAGAATA